MSRKKWLILTAMTAVIYFVTARVGFLMAIPPGNVTAVWPPSGIALAFLLLFGNRLWPGVWIGSFLANFWFFSGFSVFSWTAFLTSGGIAAGSTCQAVLAAALVHRWIGNRDPFKQTRDIFKLTGAEALSCIVGATAGVSALLWGGYLSWQRVPYAWWTWWMGDVTGFMIITPLILVWAKPSSARWSSSRFFEFIAVLAALFGMCALIFMNREFYPLKYVAMPFIAWMAFRFGLKEMTAAIFIVALMAVFETARGVGPFARETLNESLLLLQAFIGTLTLTGLILSAAVAERRQARDELVRQTRFLVEANKYLEKLSQAKDDFMATVSHELRTPLTALKEGVALILERILGPVNEEQDDFLRTIDANVDRLTELINNILDLSKLEAGRLRVMRRKTDVGELIRVTLQNHKTIIGGRSVKVEAPPMPEVFADPSRVLQILGNLFSNAIKFTEETGSILVTAEDRGEFVAISIMDDGVGIANEDLPKLFQRFSQVGSAGNQPRRGTGLGLALCKELTELHKGHIEVDSKPGKGSRFTFTLPLYYSKIAMKEHFIEQAENDEANGKN